jgi:hypothetical protein
MLLGVAYSLSVQPSPKSRPLESLRHSLVGERPFRGWDELHGCVRNILEVTWRIEIQIGGISHCGGVCQICSGCSKPSRGNMSAFWSSLCLLVWRSLSIPTTIAYSDDSHHLRPLKRDILVRGSNRILSGYDGRFLCVDISGGGWRWSGLKLASISASGNWGGQGEGGKGTPGFQVTK